MTELIAFGVGFVAGVWPVVLLRIHRPQPVPEGRSIRPDGTFSPPAKKRTNPFGSRAKTKIPFGL